MVENASEAQSMLKAPFMWCVRCKNEVIDCVCPDIEKRLAELLNSPAQLAAAGNLRARKSKEGQESLYGRFRLLRRN